MQKDLWMQPALQAGEAVLLPALERRSTPVSRFGSRYLAPPLPDSAFRPASEPWEDARLPAPHSCAQSRGSMAGRSVLRAAGVRTEPFYRRSFAPRAAQKRR